MAASVYSQEDYCSTRRQSVKTRSLNVNTHVRLRLPSCILVLSSTCFCLPSVSSHPLPLFSTFHCSAFPRGTSDRERGGTDRCTWAVVTLLLHDFFFTLNWQQNMRSIATEKHAKLPSPFHIHLSLKTKDPPSLSFSFRHSHI